MRQAPEPLISNHRLMRLTAWAKLWLAWFAGAFVACLWRTDARRQLDRAAGLVARLIFLHAALRMSSPPQRPAHRLRCAQSGAMRAVIGSALRRATRAADHWSRLAAILEVLRNAEVHILRHIRRLRLGLTRRRPLTAKPGAPLGPCTRMPGATLPRLAADTS